MKKLEELTQKEFKKLQSSGLLKTIYPDTPEDYVHTLIKDVPQSAEVIDLEPILKMTDAYIKGIANGEYQKEDFEHYLYETVMMTFYGTDIFDWINKNSVE